MRLRIGFSLTLLCFILSAASLAARPIHDAVCIDGCDQWRALPAWRQTEITDRLAAIGADSFRIVSARSIVALAATTVNEAGGVIAAPAPGSAWSAAQYVILRNTTTDTVTQKVGHFTFKHPGLDDIVVEPAVTIGPLETKRIKNISDNFDSDWKQYGVDAHGLYILTIDARIEATELLVHSNGVTRFELNSSGPYGPRPFTTAGQASDYVRIVTDAETHTGTYPTIFNTNTSNVQLQMRQRGPTNREDYVDTFISAPPGVSQVGVPRSLPNGGTLTICFTGCGVGLPGTASPVYVFAVVGPGDGGTQGIRYAQPSP